MPRVNALFWPLLAALLVAGPAGADTVATVNGSTIDSALLDAYTEARALQGGGGSDYLDELVVQELLVQEAQKAKLDSSPEVMQRLELQRRSVLARAALSAYVDSHPVDEQQVRGHYEQMVAGQQGGEEYKASHILLASEEEAKTVIGELDQGAEFAALAESKSSDSSAAAGGDLGWFQAERMVPPFAEAVAGMAAGSYSKAPVQTQFGWHVILLEDSRETTPPAFEAVQEQLQQQLMSSQIQGYLESLRAGAKIERP